MRYLNCFLCFMALLVPLFSHSSGGWVGNSPMLTAAYNAPVSSRPSSTDSEDTPSDEEWNSLLLPDSQNRFELGLGYEKEESANNLFLGYAHAFSKEWTVFTTMNTKYGGTPGLTFGYSLKPGNGKGSELALLFGIYSAYIGYPEGQFILPGAGLAYSYTGDSWRLFLNLMNYKVYDLSDGTDYAGQMILNLGFDKWITNDWNFGLSAARPVAAEYSLSDYTSLFYNPKATVTKKFGRNNETSLEVNLDRPAAQGKVRWTW